MIDGKVKIFSGSIFMVKILEDINETAMVEFTELTNNTTDYSKAQIGDIKVITKMYNFTMKYQSNPICIAPHHFFETVEFFDRNVQKHALWNQ